MKYLDGIVRHLERLSRDELLARLQPGLSSSEIRDELSRLGLPRCDGLVELYGWRNGTRVTPGTSLDDVHLFPGFYFLSLEDSISNFLAFRDDDRWASTWLPVFANGGGDFYVVDFSSGSDLEHPVVGFMLDEAEHPIEYESLPAMIATIAECFEEGAFFVDDRGYLEVDDGRHVEIARRNNPRLAIWRTLILRSKTRSADGRSGSLVS